MLLLPLSTTTRLPPIFCFSNTSPNSVALFASNWNVAFWIDWKISVNPCFAAIDKGVSPRLKEWSSNKIENGAYLFLIVGIEPNLSKALTASILFPEDAEKKLVWSTINKKPWWRGVS